MRILERVEAALRRRTHFEAAVAISDLEHGGFSGRGGSSSWASMPTGFPAPLQRGTLLHAVFEATLRAAHDGGARLGEAAFAQAAMEALENERHVFPRLRLAGPPELLGHMLDATAAGTLLSTDNPDDCRYRDCRYRDLAEVCRARRDGYGKTHSPLADWSKEHIEGDGSPVFEHLRAVRGFAD